MNGGAGNRGSGRFGLRSTQDIACGLFFIALGAFGAWIARGYQMGSPVRLGTGVFPLILCWGMIISGVIILIKGFIVDGHHIGHIAWRPVILISVAATAFALLIDSAGLVAAMIAMVIPAGFAGHEFYPKEFTIFSVLLIVIGVALFIGGLGMPIKMFPWS